MNKNSSNDASSSVINGIAIASNITNIIKARFRDRINGWRKAKIIFPDAPTLRTEVAGERITQLRKLNVVLSIFLSYL